MGDDFLKNPGYESAPYYYDPRYDEAPNPFEPGAVDSDRNLQLIALETIGTTLSPERLDDLKRALEHEGCLHQNPGDEQFKKTVQNHLKTIKMARKIVYARSK